MSSHGPSWYKVFATGLAITYLFFLIMVSQCTFSLSDPISLFNTFLCVLYVGFSLLCLIMGLAVSLVGFEHAKKQGKNRGFYLMLMVYLIPGFFSIIFYRFL